MRLKDYNSSEPIFVDANIYLDFALRCYEVVDKFKELLKTLKGLEIYSVSGNDYEQAVVLGSLYRLLPTDALHASVMENNNILNIATRDRDFNRIESFKVWMPL